MNSIDECTSLDDVTKWRQADYERNLRSKNNYEAVLVGIYEKPTHFVYELLQNADDAGAKKVKFELTDNSLTFYHDGHKDFSLKDIISITGVGNSTKKDGKSVGKFGVGFKSVFAVTDEPSIYNRAYNFKIEHMTVPKKIHGCPLGDYTTIFKLPFKSNKYSNKNIYQKIRQELFGLDCATLMFLRNISTLEISTRNGTKMIDLMRKKHRGYEEIIDERTEDKYLLFKDSSNIYSVAFAYDGKKILRLENLNIYSFLPTKVASGLAFHIDGPFSLATTRESIDFDDNWNTQVVNSIIDVFEKSLVTLRDIGLLKQDFLDDILPIERRLSEQYEVYNLFYSRMAQIFKNNRLLPTTAKTYVYPAEGALYLTPKMAKLSEYGKSWIDITPGHYEIRNFLLRETAVELVDLIDFIKYVQGDLDNKSKEWLYDFYSLIVDEHTDSWHDRGEQIRLLKSLPIVITRTGVFKCAYIGDEEQIFRPSNGVNSSKIIHAMFLNSKQSEDRQNKMREFLSLLDIKERTPRQMIEMTILPKWELANIDEREKLFLEIVNIYNVSNSTNKSDMRSLLADKKIFLCGDGEKKYWSIASEIMCGSDDQRRVFKKGLFIDNKFYTDELVYDEKSKQEIQTGSRSFCEDMGTIVNLPISCKIQEQYSWACRELENDMLDRYGVSHDIYPRWWVSSSYYIKDFKEIISDIKSTAATKSLIELLIKTPDNQMRDTVSGNYGGGAYTFQSKALIPADFFRVLNEEKWIFDEGKLKRSLDFSKDEFADKFSLSGNETFLDLIGLRRNYEESLSEKDRRGIELSQGLNEEQLKEMEEFKRKLLGRDKNTSLMTNNSFDECDILEDYPALSTNLKEADVAIDDVFLNEDTFGDDTGGINEKGSIQRTESIPESHRPEFNTADIESSAYRKALGDLGESKINAILIDKYGEDNVTWFGGKNKGYDFIITQNGQIEKYIEVKTIGKNNNKFQVSPSEWNYAKIQKEKYDFYVVDAKTGTYFIINNPYQKYLDNKINIDVQAVIFKKEAA